MKIINKAISLLLGIVLFGFILSACSDSKDSKGVDSITIDESQIKKMYNDEMGVLVKLADGDFQLKATSNQGSSAVKFRGGNDELFTVTPDGVITPIAEGLGALVVYASDNSGYFTTYKVEIRKDGVTTNLRNNLFEVQETRKLSLHDQLIIKLDEGLDRTIKYEIEDATIAEVDDAGVIKGLKVGITKIKAWSVLEPENPDYVAVIDLNIIERQTLYIDLDRAKWTSKQSHDRPADSKIKNAENSHIDNDNATCLSLVKPGKSYDGITVGANEAVFFTIDMKKKEEFSYMQFRHREDDKNVNLRAWQVSIYGSNDGTDYEVIAENVDVPNAQTGAELSSGPIPIPLSSYQYVKVQYTTWATASHSSIQVAEFDLGLID